MKRITVAKILNALALLGLVCILLLVALAALLHIRYQPVLGWFGEAEGRALTRIALTALFNGPLPVALVAVLAGIVLLSARYSLKKQLLSDAQNARFIKLHKTVRPQLTLSFVLVLLCLLVEIGAFLLVVFDIG